MMVPKYSLRTASTLLATSLLCASVTAQSFVINTADIPQGSPFNNNDTENVDFGDVDGDGDWDAAFADGGEDNFDQNRLWLNQGPGAGLGLFVDVTAAQLPTVNDSTRDVEFADIDADGDLDLYVANHCQIFNQASRWWVNTGAGFYADETATRWVNLGGVGSSVAPTHVLASGGFIDWSGDADFGDLDSDGDLDLFHSSYGGVFGGQVPSRIFLNDGAGFFSEFNPSGFQVSGSNIQNGNPGIWCEGTQQSNTTDSSGAFCDVATSAVDMDLGDIDGDFDLDVLLGARTEMPRMFANRLVENSGQLGFRDVTSSTFPVDYVVGTGHYDQEMGDLDGDGDLDIFGLNWQVNGLGFHDATLENLGNGVYANTTVLPNSASDDEEGDFIDYDNDGDLDIFVANFSGQDRLYRNRNDGGSGFSFVDVTASQLPTWGPISKDMDACDVDGDGDYDAFVGESLHVANVYLENITGIPDQFAPYIPQIEQAPNRVPSATPTVIRAQVYDNAPESITAFNQTLLMYSIDGGAPLGVDMTSSGAQIFRGEIPGTVVGTIVYWVNSSDEYGNTGVSAVRAYTSNSGASAGVVICLGDASGGFCPCGNFGAQGAGCSNSTGAGATLSTSGSASVAAADFGLSAAGMVPNKAGVFFQGESTVNGGNGSAWGDGLLCAGGNLIRLEVVMADGFGSSATSVSLVQAGSVSAGQTRIYQLFYRDPQASPCGGNFNSSGAIEVVWFP